MGNNRITVAKKVAINVSLVIINYPYIDIQVGSYQDGNNKVKYNKLSLVFINKKIIIFQIFILNKFLLVIYLFTLFVYFGKLISIN